MTGAGLLREPLHLGAPLFSARSRGDSVYLKTSRGGSVLLGLSRSSRWPSLSLRCRTLPGRLRAAVLNGFLGIRLALTCSRSGSYDVTKCPRRVKLCTGKGISFSSESREPRPVIHRDALEKCRTRGGRVKRRTVVRLVSVGKLP